MFSARARRTPAAALLLSASLVACSGAGSTTGATGATGEATSDTSSDATTQGTTSASSTGETSSDATTSSTTSATTTSTTTGATTTSSTTNTTATTDTTGATTSTTSTTEGTTDGSSTAVMSEGSGTTSGDPTTTTEDTGTTTGDDTGTTGECVLGAAAEATAMKLDAATAGVTYPSESDYPWTVVTFACAAPVTVDNLKAIIAPVYVPHQGEAPLAERKIEPRTIAQLFDPLTVPKDWWSDYEFMQAESYTAIRAVLEDNLSDLQVFRLGEEDGGILSGAIDVYVLGSTGDGDLVGMWTVSIET
ncbi:MAG: nuclease A inhibitor family protein [Nannocystaceae bacterium]